MSSDTTQTGRAIRGAVIGYGGAFNMGKGHLEWMSKAGFVPTAACDLDEERLSVAKQDFPGIATYMSVDDLLSDAGVDIVVLITPHNSHARLAVQALDAGKHVITEKPMCITSAEATAMIDAAAENDRLLTVFHNRRWDGDFQALKEAVVDRKLIGDVFAIEAGFAGYRHPGHWWRSQKEMSGGLFYDWGAHFLDWILTLLPGQKAEAVTGFSNKSVWTDVTTEDYVQAIVRFTGGVKVDLSFSQISAAPKPRWRISGTQGAIVDDGSVRDGFKLFRHIDGQVLTGELHNKRADPALLFYQNLWAHMTAGAELEVKATQARRIISIIEAAETSWHSGRSEPVPYEFEPSS